MQTPFVRQWGAFLSEFNWSHFVTLTTRHAVGRDCLVREFKDVFIRRLAFESLASVPWFYAVECTAAGHPHLHALVSAAPTLTSADVERCWGLGYARAGRYNPARGAAYYLTKHLEMDPDGYDLSRRLRRRRAA